MVYTPPPAMQFSPANFGSMAPGGGLGALAGLLKPQQPGQQQQYPDGMLGAISSAAQGNPQGGLAKQLFGGAPQPSAPGDPTAGASPAAPPQMGMLAGLLPGLMQKLGIGGASMAGGAAGGALGGGGPAPTALTGLW